MKSQAIADREAFLASPMKKAQDQLDAENLATTRRVVGRFSQYAEAIREDLAKAGHIGKYDHRHIEAYMRLEHSTLDGLSARQFRAEVEVARQCVDLGGSDAAEECALSYGL